MPTGPCFRYQPPVATVSDPRICTNLHQGKIMTLGERTGMPRHRATRAPWPAILGMAWLIIAWLAGGVSMVQAEELPKTLPITFFNEESIVANTVIARAPAGVLPTTLTHRSFTLTQLTRLTLFGGRDDMVVYYIAPQPGFPVDYGLVIQFLQQQVPSACVDVNPIHGSPSSYPIGTSNYPIADPFAGSPAPDPAAQQELFWHQWAFAQIEYAGGGGPDGSNTLVAILDAFPAAGGSPGVGVDLTVLPDLAGLAVAYDPALPNLEEHGLFVASLAAALAPGATYWAAPTLNANAIGSLHTLVAALDQVLTQFPTSGLDHLVINMSLGAERLDNCNLVVDLLAAGQSAYDVLYVAASGNGNQDPLNPIEPLFPARLENVLAVSASTAWGAPAPYAQAGALMAPGGAMPNAQGDSCDDLAYCVAGYYAPDPTGLFALRASSGTSFASPLVAGAAARLFSGLNTNAPEVTTCLLQGAAGHNGILDVQFCLSNGQLTTQTGISGADGSLSPVGDLQFVVNVRHVIAHSLQTDLQLFNDGGIRFALGNEG